MEAAYFSLRNGAWCRCGEGPGDVDKLRPSMCPHRCPGDKSSACGGSVDYDLYKMVERRQADSSVVSSGLRDGIPES